MYQKRIILQLFYLLSFSITQSQNLLPNPSFEDQNICDEHTAKCSPAAWFFSRQLTAQGFYTTNKIPGIVGNNYLGLIAAQPNTEKRSYWETQLLCAIEKGKKYIIRLQVAADQVGPNLNDIGIFFTNNFIFSWTDTLLQPDNYISLLDAKVKKLKNNWFLIEKEFEASNNYTHFIIGNFSQTSNTEILLKLGIKTTYNILIDDLSLTSSKPIHCDGSTIEKSLYAITKRHLDSYAPKTPVVAAPPVIATPSTEAVAVDTLVIPNVLFDLNSFTLKNDAALDTYQPYFSDPSITKIRVVGFTDAAGSVAYNLKLSSRRAQEVARVLRDRYHVPFALIETEGKGISKDFEERERNRRVEVYVYH